MKKLLTFLFFPAILFAAQEKEPVVVNSPLHPWYANGGTDLIVNFSKINFDTRLLKMIRKHKEVKYPFINLSGRLDMTTSVAKPSTSSNAKFKTQILSAKMHVTSVVKRNVVGHLAWKFKFDKHTRKNGLLLERAFISFDLKDYCPVFPTYVTIGKLFMPFGTHKTFQSSEPFTSSIGKVDGEIIKAGFNLHKSLQGSAFISNKREAGADLKYNLSIEKTKLELGTSFISKRSFFGSSIMPFVSFEVNKIGIRSELLSALTKDKINRRLISGRVETFYSFDINNKFCSTALAYETLFNKDFKDQPRYRVNTTFNTVFSVFTFTSFELKFEEANDTKKTKVYGASFKFGIVY